MTLGDKVCYESYLGCGDQDMVYGHITKIYGDSFIITDIDGVEHTVYDKSRIFKVEKFPYSCKKFLDAYIYVFYKKYIFTFIQVDNCCF